MGDPRRIKRVWEGPRHPWRSDDLSEGLILIGEYGLRNKKELFKAQTIARRYRKMAREILALPESERMVNERELILRLYKRGFIKYQDATADAVLSLTAKDVLERRLQTIVYRKGFAPTIHAARQMVVHRHINVNGRIVDIPGYLVSVDEEDQVKISPRSTFYSRAQQKITEGIIEKKEG
ncbi:MAG: 30S ribosomal protein S4 [Thermoprotei archaeon]